MYTIKSSETRQCYCYMIDVHMAYYDKTVRLDLLFVSVGFCLGEVMAAKKQGENYECFS